MALTDELIEMVEEYTVREILYRLVDAMEVIAPEEENPEAWERGARAIEKLAESKDFEEMVSW